jgi:hypothetical protein
VGFDVAHIGKQVLCRVFCKITILWVMITGRTLLCALLVSWSRVWDAIQHTVPALSDARTNIPFVSIKVSRCLTPFLRVLTVFRSTLQ